MKLLILLLTTPSTSMTSKTFTNALPKELIPYAKIPCR